MDQNETTDEYTPIDMKKELAKVLLLVLANVAGRIIGVIVAGYIFTKIVNYVEARKAKKALHIVKD